MLGAAKSRVLEMGAINEDADEEYANSMLTQCIQLYETEAVMVAVRTWVERLKTRAAIFMVDNSSLQG